MRIQSRDMTKYSQEDLLSRVLGVRNAAKDCNGSSDNSSFVEFYESTEGLEVAGLRGSHEFVDRTCR